MIFVLWVFCFYSALSPSLCYQKLLHSLRLLPTSLPDAVLSLLNDSYFLTGIPEMPPETPTRDGEV